MIMMIKWFDQAKSFRHHQAKAMGKPRVVGKMDSLQTLTFLSFLDTEEPHVRPCEVVQGWKRYSTWSWLFPVLLNLLLGGQPLKKCSVLLVSWCLKEGTGWVTALITEQDAAGGGGRTIWVFLCSHLTHGGYCTPAWPYKQMLSCS